VVWAARTISGIAYSGGLVEGKDAKTRLVVVDIHLLVGLWFTFQFDAKF
jgi:hypothetical protein